MSLNQSRAEKSEGQVKKPGRSGSSGQHRGFSGGGGKGGGSAPPFSSITSPGAPSSPALSANRSFRKSGNGQGGPSRVNPTASGSDPSFAAGTAHRAVQNGAHALAPVHGSSNTPSPSGSKPVDMPLPRNPSRAVPRAPTSQSPSGALDSSAPSALAQGDASRAFTLQFGTINPGIMNGMQIPARTSSAPPNLDEQKRDQARHDSFRNAPTVPLSAVPKHQQNQTRRDVGGANPSNSGESHPPPQTKRDVHVPASLAPTAVPPKSSVLPMPAMPMPIPFQHQQPQVPLQFGGPTPQIQSQGVAASSLQMTMTLPVGNASQVPQQMFVPGIQTHPLQQQAMLHQGQSLGFAPPMGHQLPPQLGNLGMGITSQFPQQQPGKFGGPRKTTVKITHPETHEELRLDKRTDSYADSVSSGQRPHPNVTPQSQPIPAFTPSHQINYYSSLPPNSYNPSPIFFPTTSMPLTSTQMPTGSQASRYTYPVSQSGQPMSFMNPSHLNPMPGGKPGPPTSLHGVSEGLHLEGLPVSAPSASIQVTVKPPVGSRVEKVGAPSVTPSVIISMPNSKAEPPKVLKPIGDTILSHQQKGSEIGPESSIQLAKSVQESSGNVSLPETEGCSTVAPPLSSNHRTLPDTSSSVSVTSIGDSVTISAGNDGRKREPVRRSESLKDQPKKPSKKDLRHLQQQHQLDALGSADVAKVSALKIIDSSATDLLARNPDSAQAPSVADSVSSLTSLLTSGTDNKISSETRASDNVEGGAIPTGSGSSGLTSEKDESQDAPINRPDAFESATGGLSIKEGGPFEAPTSLCRELDSTVPKDLGTSVSQDDMSAEVGQTPEMQAAAEHLMTEVSNDSLKDFNNAELSPVSIVKESSEDANTIASIKLRDAVVENSEKMCECDGENQLGETSKDAVVCSLEVDRTAEGVDRSPTVSSNLIEAESVSSDHMRASFDERTNNYEGTCSQDVGSKHPGTSSLVTIPVADSTLSETIEKLEGKVLESSTGRPSSPMLSGPKEKPSLEATKPKTTAGKKKKRKEILSKADAAGASDLYNAYKGPEEKHENIRTSESVDSSATTEAKRVPVEHPDKAVAAIEEDAQSKAELDDWEDAAEISTPKLRTPGHGQLVNGAKKQSGEDGTDATGRKKYSRDFLLTFQHQCTDLPVCFEIGSDIADALMSVPVGKSYVVEREPYPSPGRIIDRPSGASRIDRRMAGITDDDKWTKSPASFGPGRDLRLDVGHGATVVNFRPGQGANHGVLRNPRGQASNQFTGGILSGPMQSLASQGGIPRNGPDADRWQRATGIQRGLIPSPQTTLPVMHKAEKKYEVGKVSDKEVGRQRQLKAILNKLTPQNFDKLFQQVKEVNIDNTVTLTGVISQIFDKALMEPTFCEMYANFCFHLAGALPDFHEDNEKITFKRLLLNKCQEEFERGEREQAEANKTEEEGEIKQSAEEREEKRLRARRRMLGNIRLIGELYKKRMLTERIMHECIKKLLVDQFPNPDEEDLEALCKLMSTIGEMIDHSKAKEHMDAYFDMMLKLSTNSKLSSRVRFMLKDAIDLRKNKWQQRRKVEGPKKIDEVHRDAAQERHTQARGLARGPVISSAARRGPPVDYGTRASSALTSPSSLQVGGVRGISPQVRGYGTQDVRMDDRHQFENRTLSLPLPQRPIDDITLGPQGGLAKGMSIRGQPLMSTVPSTEIPQNVGDHRRMASAPNGSVPDWSPHNSREETTSRSVSDRLPGAPHDQAGLQDRNSYFGSRDTRTAEHASSRSMTTMLPAGRNLGSSTISQNAPSEIKTFSEEVLREKSISAIREFYSAKDEEEVALCVKELNAPSFYPLMVYFWVTDSFERKDMERDLLAKLLVNLSKPGEGLLSQGQLVQGFESVLSSLEDAVNDAPRAAEFLGRIFAKVIMENLVSLKEIGRLVHEGGEEPGQLREIGLAADVLGSILESIRIEKGDPILNEILASSSLRLEDFRPPHPLKSKKLDAFL